MTSDSRFPALRWPAIAALCCALAACGNQPPAADWALNADSGAERATQAYLRGDARVQALEWSKARSEVERTARPQLMARLALMRCAAEQASLDWKDCVDYAAVAIDAEPAEQIYAAYLQAQPLSAQDIARLPAAQQPVARALQDRGAALAAVKAVKEPLSRMVAASVVLRAQGPSDGLLAEAVDTASAQGWRRPLLAWLLLYVKEAREAGDERLAQALERRAQVLQGAAARGAAR